MNARLMRGPSLGNKRNMRKITAWVPENQNSIKCFKVLELISDLKVRGIPVLNKNAQKNVAVVTEKAGSERLLVRTQVVYFLLFAILLV